MARRPSEELERDFRFWHGERTLESLSLYLMAGALAVFIGVFMGMLGGGGTILLVPILLYVLKLPVKSALATAQLTMVTSAGLAMLVHARHGRVMWRKGLTFGTVGMCGAYLGGRVAHYLSPRILLLGFATIMSLAALEMLRRGSSVSTEKPLNASLVRDVAVAFSIGLVAGLLGAGGGFLLVPAFTLLEGLSLELAVGTSLLVIAMQSLAGALGYLLHVEVNIPLTALLAAGMALGSTCGSLLSHRLPASLLRRMFAGFLLAVALFMLGRNL
jgi:uncharacterized membrane protein YfcA